MIHNIAFDFGGVLVEYDFPKYFTKFFGNRDKAIWLINNFLTEENNDKLDKADKPFDEYIAEWEQPRSMLAHWMLLTNIMQIFILMRFLA